MARSFWDRAAAATKRELGITSPQAVIASPRSACVELPPASRVSLAGAGALMAAQLLLGLALLLAAIVLGILAWTGRLHTPAPAWLWPTGALAVGILFIWVGLGAETRRFRRIAPLPGRDSGNLGSEPVGIEPPETYRHFRIFADDLGILYHDPANARLLLMSTSHCCCRCAPDVISLSKGEGGLGSGVQVDVRVGSTTLSLVLSARKHLYDPENPEQPYDPKGYFLEGLRRTLQGGREDGVVAQEFDDELEEGGP